MKPQERLDWIERHVRDNNQLSRGGVDVLNSDFVDAYIDATKAAFRPTNYGAYKCAQLGRDLAKMVDQGIMRRHRIGIEGLAGMGFPRWVWSYTLTHR